MKKFFGTDGVRASSNSQKLNGLTLIKLGMALGKHFTVGEHRHKVVIGKDTRLSGYMIEQALTSGLLSMGMDVFLFGPCLLYTSPSPRDYAASRMPSSA